MPIVSGGGGGGNTTAQVVASGKVLPVAAPTGVTIDSTTYSDPFAGGGAKLTTLVFPASSRGALAIAVAGDAWPRWLLGANPDAGLYFGDGTADPTAGGNIYFSDGISLSASAPNTVSMNNLAAAGGADSPPRVDQLSPRFTITSGLLPTVTLSSGVGTRLSLTRDVESHTPVTFNPGVATTATCEIALSPDDTTYTVMSTVASPVGTVFDGEVLDIAVRVPARWYLRLTVNAQASLGTTYYY